mgnify:CR=1 FL=1
MTERLGLARRTWRRPRPCSSEHGNMSSVTVLFVLDEMLRSRAPAGRASAGCWARSVPGFGAEFALLEFA